MRSDRHFLGGILITLIAMAALGTGQAVAGVIVFDHCAAHHQGITGLCSIAPNGRHLTQLTDTGETNPSVSPNGKSIAFNCGLYSKVQGGVCLKTGKHVRALTRTGADPSWAPNGKQIVFDSCQKGGVDGGICIVNVRTGSIRRLTANSNDQLPAWSPKGSRIAFVITVPFDSSSGVYVTPVKHVHPHQLVEIVAFDVSWSPNGGKLAYDHGYDGAWVMHANGSDNHQLVTSTDNFTHASWSLSGTQLVGILNDRLHVVSASGGKPRQISHTDAADPSWGK